MANSILKYPLDRTGVASTNQVVKEEHALSGTATNKVVVLNYGPFFTDGLVVYDQYGNALNKGSQYVAANLMADETASTGKEVCQYLVITDPAVTSKVLVTAQMLGGMYSLSVTALMDAIATLSLDNRTVAWGDIIAKPELFKPGSHLHDIGDVYGFEYLVLAITDIVDAVDRLTAANTTGNIVDLSPIVALINNIKATLTEYLKTADAQTQFTLLTTFNTAVTNINTALATKAPLVSPVLAGTPASTTPPNTDNSTRISTTAFVKSVLLQYGIGTNDLSDWSGDLNNLTTSGLWLAATNTNAPNPAISAWFVLVMPNANGAYTFQLATPQATNELWFRTSNNSAWSSWINVAGLASPSFSGIPSAPTASAGNSSTQIANTSFVQSTVLSVVSAAINALVNGAPGSLSTLSALAAAVGNNPSFANDIINLLNAKAPIDSPAFTGVPTGPTADYGTNNDQFATTAFVQAAMQSISLVSDNFSYFKIGSWTIQMGTVNPPNNGTYILQTFPVAFNSACRFVVGNEISTGAHTSQFIVNTATTTGFNCTFYNTGGGGSGTSLCYWMAIGT